MQEVGCGHWVYTLKEWGRGLRTGQWLGEAVLVSSPARACGEGEAGQGCYWCLARAIAQEAGAVW